MVILKPAYPLYPMDGLLRQYEDAITHLERQPLRWRKMRLRQWGHPRSLYKFRALLPPDHPNREQKLQELQYLLLDSTLWLAAATMFNDPFDGRAAFQITERGDALRDALADQFIRVTGGNRRQALAAIEQSGVTAHPERLEKELLQGHDAIRKSIGICSLSAAPSNQLMWAHYGQEHRGVCLRFSVAHDLRNLIAHKVIYDRNYPIVTSMFASSPSKEDLQPLLQKSPDWAYEKEWRIINVGQARTSLSFKPDALTAVIFGMQVDEGDSRYLLDLMQKREAKYGLQTPLFQAEAARNQYRLRFRRLR
jgi:hypothetical protein